MYSLILSNCDRNMELRRIKAELSNESTMYKVKGYRESQATFLFAVYRICILTSIYWDAKSNKVYRRFERLLEAAEISQRAFMEGKLREIERAIEHIRREMESAKIKGSPPKPLEDAPQTRQDSTKINEDRETMVVFSRKPKKEPSP